MVLRKLSLENYIQLNASCMATGCLLDQTPIRMLFTQDLAKAICLSPSTWPIEVYTKYSGLALLV